MSGGNIDRAKLNGLDPWPVTTARPASTAGRPAASISAGTSTQLLSAIVRQDRFSLFVELNALSVHRRRCSFVGGLGWTFRDYVVNLGDGAILVDPGLLMAVAFDYCFTQGRPVRQRRNRIAVDLAFDYVLYFALPGAVGDARLHRSRDSTIFHGWDDAPVASRRWCSARWRTGSTTASCCRWRCRRWRLDLGLKIDGFDTPILRSRCGFDGFLYGAFLDWHRHAVASPGASRRISSTTYLHLGANVILTAAASPACWARPAMGWSISPAAGRFSAAAIYLGVRYRRFAFVAYGTLYGYGGVSCQLLDIDRRSDRRRCSISSITGTDRRDWPARRAGATVRA